MVVRPLAVIVLLFVAAPVVEHGVLAAQKKRSCSCSKPSLRRRTRARAPRAAVASTQTPNASLVGPVFTTYTLPANQNFRLRLNQMLSSEQARIGDRFTSTVLIPVYAGGVEVVPAGATVEGRVTHVARAQSRGRSGRLGIAFDKIVLPDGSQHQIDGALADLQDQRAAGEVDQEGEVGGRSSETRNIGYIGGGTAGGAILGGVLGGGKGAGIGAAIGAGAGVAGVMLQKGHEVELRSGSEIGMITTAPVEFKLRER
jgi:type IV secretion system protein VirB10